MIKRILIAVDGSETAYHALEQALALAKAEQAEVLVVSVVPAYQGDLRLMGSTEALKGMREPFAKAFDKAMRAAKAAGVPCTGKLLEGEPYEAILSLAEAEQVDLVAIGKCGTGFHHLLPMGTVASRIIGLSTCDVLIVPDSVQLDTKRILLPFDGSAHARKASDKAMEIAARYGSELAVLTAVDLPLEGFALDSSLMERFTAESRGLQAEVLRMAGGRGVRQTRALVREGHPRAEIVAAVREEQPGLIIMGSHGRSGLKALLLGSVAQAVIASGVSPVLIAK
ncbi:universal stress protein [Desulfocurvibacter africanus]|uniref:universal stress protein n=1 Tax=Desulfocurvibacter africanus TaxID=873 RepID=UPI0004270A5B|nr:universal stress protein [Desulfocurvibacter africanus]